MKRQAFTILRDKNDTTTLTKGQTEKSLRP